MTPDQFQLVRAYLYEHSHVSFSHQQLQHVESILLRELLLVKKLEMFQQGETLATLNALNENSKSWRAIAELLHFIVSELRKIKGDE